MMIVNLLDLEEFIDPEKEVLDAESALAGARDIIAEMVSDDAALRKQLRETPRMREIDRLLIEVEILGIEMFFLSDWFCMLTDVDGGMILERLKKEEDANDGKGVSAAGLSA